MTGMLTRRAWIYGGVAAVAAATGGGMWWRQSFLEAKKAAAHFWDQRYERLEGGELSIGNLRGQRLLVNFWATWCGPCIEELPLLDAFYRDHVAKGWQVLGLAIDRSAAVRDFLTRSPVSFPIALAMTQQGLALLSHLGNPAGVLPFSVLFDPEGGVITRKMGKIEPSDLEAWQHSALHG